MFGFVHFEIEICCYETESSRTKAMVVVKVSVHPQGLGPVEAARAWYFSALKSEIAIF